MEAQCAGYKSRLDELRKAKNNLIIKKTTEYVKTNVPAANDKEEILADPIPEPKPSVNPVSQLNLLKINEPEFHLITFLGGLH